MANEVTIVVKSKDSTDFTKFGTKARTQLHDSMKGGLDDVEKETTSRFSEIGDRSGRTLSDRLDEHLKRWSHDVGDQVTQPLKRSFEHITEEIDVKVTKKFKEVGDHSGNAITDGLKGSLGAVEGIGTKAGGDLTASFGKSASSGLSSMSSVLWPALIVGIVSLAPAAGALLAAGIVFAFGAGLAGLGLVAAWHIKSVQKEFGQFKKFLSDFMKDIGKPFKETWATIFNVAGNVLKKLQPVLKGAFKDFIAPAVTRFVLKLGEAFMKLEPAIRPLSKAFGLLLDSVGDQLPGIFESMAKALTDIADEVSKNPELFANFITGLFKLFVYGLKVVAFLAKLYDQFSKFAHTKNPLTLMFDALVPTGALLSHFNGKIQDVMGVLARATKKAYKFTISAVSKVAGPVASATGAVMKFARGSYRGILIGVNKVGGPVASASRAALGFARRAYRANLTALSRVAGPVSSALNACRRFARGMYRANLTALNRVWQAFNDAMHLGQTWASKVFTATFNVFKSIIPGMAHGGIVGGMATGGISHAAGGGPRNGLTLVGEQGAELVSLPGGSRVTPHGQSMSKLAQMGGGGSTHLTVEWVGGNAAGPFFEWIRANIRFKAGDGPNSVQKALGG